MKIKTKKHLGFTLLPFAFFFLFEPNLALNDYLPDFIGYIIICIALINLSDVNNRISDAVSGFKRGIVISALRYVAIYMLQNVFGIDQLYSDNETSVGTLLFAFIFAILEIIILLPAYKNLFEGLLSLGMMHDGSYVYHKNIHRRIVTDPESGKKIMYVREGKRNASEKLYSLTAVFLVIRCAAYVLPEFTSLTDNSSYEFIVHLRWLSFAIALPICIAWLVSTLVYFINVRRDTPFIANLSEFYIRQISERPNVITVRSISSGLCVIITAFAFSMDFYTDHLNIIPNALFYLLVAIGAIMLFKYSKKWIPILALSSVGAIISTYTRSIATALYSDPEFTPVAVKVDIEAYNSFYNVASFTILDVALTLITVIFTVLLVWDVYKRHSNLAPSLAKNEARDVKEHKLSFAKWTVAIILAATFSSAANIYYMFVQPFENVEEWYFYYSPIIAIVASVIFAIVAVYFTVFIINSVKFRYSREL